MPTNNSLQLLLKNPLIRNGIAFLEPACIELKGGINHDREDRQQKIFLGNLAVRMG